MLGAGDRVSQNEAGLEESRGNTRGELSDGRRAVRKNARRKRTEPKCLSREAIAVENEEEVEYSGEEVEE